MSERSAFPGLQTYWQLSRSVRYGFTFVLPLLAMYEILAALLNPGAPGAGLRNGADVLLRSAFAAVAGPKGPVVFGALLFFALATIAIRDAWRHRQPLQGRVFAFMFLESSVLASLLGVVVGNITAGLLQAFPSQVFPFALGPLEELGWPAGLMIALGAGLYEELLFRVVLVGALVYAARRFLGMGTAASAVIGSLTGALIFAWMHYVGPFGDPFDVASFTFRTVAGLAFSLLYVGRGFGITAWTHALYDIFLLVARA
jgi:membrane protease YdiL (CAAX protease family)